MVKAAIQSIRENLGEKYLFLAFALFTLTPWCSPPLALLLGIILALLPGAHAPVINKAVTTYLLQGSVVGLGFGVHVSEALQAGKAGVLLTIGTILLTVLLGLLIGRWLAYNRKVSYLISCGTAICGGSAIAAVAPIIQAEKEEISVSLATVFILNSVALFLFPAIGSLLDMSQQEFGLWAAIGIHDTSSVVGAATKFGEEALHTATTVKLVRALWIIPLALVTSYVYRKRSGVSFPYFIIGFLLAMLISTYIPGLEEISALIVLISKKGLTLTLFLIGAGLSRNMLRTVGARPFIHGLCLWIIISVVSLSLILNHLYL
jgi:uncharacterized integral membrane protein (TIGR00698 family)